MAISIPLTVIGMNIIGLLLVAIRLVMFSLSIDKQYDVATCQTVGNREIQEDYFHCEECKKATLLAMSDGMGRNYGGRLAARIAVETSVDLFENYQPFDTPNYYFRKTFSTINKEILRHLDGVNGQASLLNVLLQDGHLYYALVGNVKLFLFRKGHLIEITYGHTIDMLANNQYKKGKIKRQDAIQVLSERRSYNFIGRDGFYDIEFFDEPVFLERKDIVVLMTDGLIETLGHKKIEDMLKQNKKTMDKLAFELIEAVNKDENQEKDNASVMLLKVKR